MNKDETIKKYGIEQVKIWRRGFDTSPPKMEPGHPLKNKIKSEILGESLKDNPISIGNHCFGCTAGAGSSCGGELT